MSERIKYIDALRGLAMLMVVMVHVEGFSVFVEEFHMSLFRRLCEALMLPLFFFISGFLARPCSENKLFKKSMQLLIPACVWGILYTFHIHKDITSFFLNVYKFGYWFTITLLEMLVVLSVISKCIRGNRALAGTILLVATLLYLAKVPFNQIAELKIIADASCLHQLFIYFHFFAVGYILANNKNIYNKLLDSEVIIVCSICVFCCALYIKYTYTDEQLAANSILRLYRALQDPILGYSGIAILLRFFKRRQIFIAESLLGKTLQYTGRHTLDIYLLHYFFLPKLPALGLTLMKSNNIIVEIALVALMSTLVISCSLLLSKIIKTNSIAGYVLLGSKVKSTRKTQIYA